MRDLLAWGSWSLSSDFRDTWQSSLHFTTLQGHKGIGLSFTRSDNLERQRGKMLLKKGRIFRNGSGDNAPRLVYARAIRDALRGELGSTTSANKTVRQWTGAGERTIKNWFDGTCGPRGEHLLLLAYHSDSVFEIILTLTEREHGVVEARLLKHCEAMIKTIRGRRPLD